MRATFPPLSRGFPPVWDLLPQLPPPSRPQSVVRQGELAGHVPAGVLDRRGLLLADEGRLASQGRYVADWIADVLDLRDAEYWAALRLGVRLPHRNLLLRPRRRRVGLLRVLPRPAPVAKPRSDSDAVGRPSWGSRPVSRLTGFYSFGGVSLPSASLHFVGGGERLTGSHHLVRSRRLRGIPTRFGLPTGFFDSWCAADPEQDRVVVAEGGIPAVRRRQVGPISTGRMFTWAKLAGEGRPLAVDTVSLEVHPPTAELISVRRATVPLELLLCVHPRYHCWLQQAFGLETHAAHDEDASACLCRVHSRLLELLAADDRERLVQWLRTFAAYAEHESLLAVEKEHFISRQTAAKHLATLQNALGMDDKLVWTRVDCGPKASGLTPLSRRVAEILASHPEYTS